MSRPKISNYGQALDADESTALDYVGNRRQLVEMVNEHATALDSMISTADVFSVLAYGADPSGVADSTTAIRNAMAAAWARVQATGRRATIDFPAGVFYMTNRTGIIHLDVNAMHSLVFRGAGGGQSLLKLVGDAAGANWHMFEIHGGSYDIEYRNLSMLMSITNPNGAEQNHIVQVGNNCRDIRFVDCELSGSPGDGIRQLGEFGNPVDDVVIRGCRFIDCKRAAISFQRWVRHTTISDCQFFAGNPGDQQIDFEPTGYSLVADAGGNATTLIDASCTFVTWGMKVGDPIYNVTYDVLCYITAVTETQLTISAGATTWDTADYYFPLHNSGHIIEGCQFRRDGRCDLLITLSGSWGVQLIGNSIYGKLQAQDAMRAIIALNNFELVATTDSGTVALTLIKACYAIQVERNSIIVRSLDAGGASGISVYYQLRAPHSCTIAGNNIRMECTGGGIAVASCGSTTIVNNKIVLNAPGVTNAGAINVRSTSAPISTAVVLDNEISAEQGTFSDGLQIAANPFAITQCVLGGGVINNCTNPITFAEAGGGTFTTPPILMPTAIGGGGSSLVAPISLSWVKLAGFGGTAGVGYKPGVFWGTGTPEGVLAAGVGCIALRSNGGAGTTLYVKESGTGNTGWVGK
jgi:hypothetical protein